MMKPTRKQLRQPLRVAHLETIGKFIAEQIKPLRTRVEELERRPSLKYSGTWQMDKSYSAGEFATHAGSLWHCNESCIGVVPGSGAPWVLAVKRGRDAK